MHFRTLHQVRRLATQAILRPHLRQRFSTNVIARHIDASPRQSGKGTGTAEAKVSNPLVDLMRSYRLATSPLPTHLQDPVPRRKNKIEEAETYLKNQRKARHGLKLYYTLTPEELPIFYTNLNNLDYEQEIQSQERPRIPEVLDAAKNDSQWEIETQYKHQEARQDETSTAIGKRLTKVYRFPSWTLASRHFWKRMDECFEAQDVSRFCVRLLAHLFM